MTPALVSRHVSVHHFGTSSFRYVGEKGGGDLTKWVDAMLLDHGETRRSGLRHSSLLGGMIPVVGGCMLLLPSVGSHTAAGPGIRRIDRQRSVSVASLLILFPSRLGGNLEYTTSAMYDEHDDAYSKSINQQPDAREDQEPKAPSGALCTVACTRDRGSIILSLSGYRDET